MKRRDFLRVAVAGAGLAFTTALPSGAQTPQPEPVTQISEFKFGIIADPHCSEPTKPGLSQYGNGIKKFSACFNEINKLSPEEQPDFVLILGDIHLWKLHQILPEITVPLHVIAGNHERDSKSRTEMRNLFPDDFIKNGKESDYYAFVHKGVRFIGVCNAGMGDHVGHLNSEIIKPFGQCQWLETQLKKEESQKIIFAHIPPHPKNEERNGWMCRNDSAFFNTLVEQTKPTAMFFGHHHLDTRISDYHNTKSVIIRSCCWNGDKSDLGFMMVKITPSEMETREIITGTYS